MRGLEAESCGPVSSGPQAVCGTFYSAPSLGQTMEYCLAMLGSLDYEASKTSSGFALPMFYNCVSGVPETSRFQTIFFECTRCSRLWILSVVNLGNE